MFVTYAKGNRLKFILINYMNVLGMVRKIRKRIIIHGNRNCLQKKNIADHLTIKSIKTCNQKYVQQSYDMYQNTYCKTFAFS